ncbi:MAG: 1,4-dihydroxy-2-naphthoate polyprenyltransferase [Chloroflexi bacterium]|nr:1,4-dihydroxy-2-naphthoate polyprenyltransferase [Chloroflexota bacterium]MBK7176807.1 1,4-dihydroxy-2-naphthoate polyprenyltransferase [Chloroflexota bacterium]MBK7918180.1 1,4-dihydroxy-2-naphthoate polyprenyltransferase [Chloroflexota bacterium]MBK8932282.1 1,4-dihydroxy-2-naphthoate polyprenyltransferase [Chloroflexota bacterium]
MTQPTQLPTPAQAWIAAMRPRTLPLAVASSILGGFLAAADGLFNWLVTLLCVITAVFLQILSNLANDYGDSVHGADHVERAGPKRAVQSGLITSAQMKRAMALFAGLSAVSGLALVIVALGVAALPLVALFVVLGGAAIWAAVSYTASSKPYGYVGLGDLFVFIFFGWVGTMGTYFLQAQALNGLVLLPATSVGLLSVAVLNVNNIRDIESDQKAGKRSIPVRIGPQRARVYHWILLGGAVASALLFVGLTYRSPWQFLFGLSLPLLWRHGTAVARTTDPLKLNPMLKQLSLTTLVFVFTFGLGQIL